MSLSPFVNNGGLNNLDNWAAAFDSPSEFYMFFTQKLQKLTENMNQTDLFLEQFNTYVDQSQCQEKLIMDQKNSIRDLHGYISTLNNKMIEERKNYQKLIAELELTTLDRDHHKRNYQAALIVGNLTDKDIDDFVGKTPKSFGIIDRITDIKQEMNQLLKPGEKMRIDPEVQARTIEILQDKLTNLEMLQQHRDAILAKSTELADRESEISIKEANVRAEEMSDNLREAKELSIALMKDNVSLRKKLILSHVDWIDERRNLTEILYPGNRSSNEDSPTDCVPERRENYNLLMQDFERAKMQLSSKENQLHDYEFKFRRMEIQSGRIKEELAVTQKKHEVESRKLRERSNLLENRSKSTEQRRKTETAGYREDIRILKQLVATLQKAVNNALVKQQKAEINIKQQKLETCQALVKVVKKRNTEALDVQKIQKILQGNLNQTNNTFETLDDISRVVQSKLDKMEEQIRNTRSSNAAGQNKRTD